MKFYTKTHKDCLCQRWYAQEVKQRKCFVEQHFKMEYIQKDSTQLGRKHNMVLQNGPYFQNMLVFFVFFLNVITVLWCHILIMFGVSSSQDWMHELKTHTLFGPSAAEPRQF